MVFVDCGGYVFIFGIYVYIMDVFGCLCFFIKRIELLVDGLLKIIFDNYYYEIFIFNIDE